MRRLFTLDEFAQLPEGKQRDSETGISTVSVEQPEFMSAEDDSRIITYTFSTGAVGRDMHTVSPDAWQTDNFQKNPVFLWAHDDTEPPIGRVVNIGDVGGKLKGAVEYADRDLNPFGDMIYRMVKARFINAVSTSWMPLAWSRSTDKNRPGGLDFKSVELLEISQVPIPAMPSALAEARSAGIDTSPLREWAERLLDTGGLITVPRTELETLRRAAKMPAVAKSTQGPALAATDRTLAAKHRRALARAPKVPQFKRGLYDLSQLCYLVASLGYCHDSAEYEADLEQDNSPVPGMLGEALVTLGEALKAMAVEEVDELLEAHGSEGDEDEDAAVEARALPAEQRAFIAAGKTPRARAWRAGIAVARAGKALSASNQEKLEDAQGHHERAMKHSRALGEHHDAVAGHLKGARAAHAEATKTLAEFGEHARAAQDEPEKAPEHLKRALKAHAKTEEHMGAIDESHEDMADRHADVGDSHQGMARSVKSAQRCMRSVLDGAEQSEPEDDEGREGDKSKAKDDVEDDDNTERAARERRSRVARALKLRGSGTAAA